MVHAECVSVAGIHPSRMYECPDLLSLCDGMPSVHRLELGLCSHPKEFWGNGVRTHVNSKGKIPSTRKILPRGGWNPRCCIKQDSEPNTLPMSYLGPAHCTDHDDTDLFVGRLTSQQHASVSQEWICSDNFTCCHTEIEVANQTFHLTQSHYTDTEPTSPSADPITPGDGRVATGVPIFKTLV